MANNFLERDSYYIYNNSMEKSKSSFYKLSLIFLFNILSFELYGYNPESMGYSFLISLVLAIVVGIIVSRFYIWKQKDLPKYLKVIYSILTVLGLALVGTFFLFFIVFKIFGYFN